MNEYDESVVSNEAITDENGEATFEMLFGYRDKNGEIQKTFTIREMTGREEEAINKADIKSNGSKVIQTLLERCVVSIGSITKKEVGIKGWEDIISSLYVGDQDYMLLKLRELSVGEDIEVSHSCPKCGASLKSTINVNEIRIEEFKGQEDIPFVLPRGYRDRKGVVHREGTCRMPKGTDRIILNPLANKNLGTATTVMLTRICKFDDKYPITEDVMRDLSTRDREYLAKLQEENSFGVDSKVNISCSECGEDVTLSLSATNFI